MASESLLSILFRSSRQSLKLLIFVCFLDFFFNVSRFGQHGELFVSKLARCVMYRCAAIISKLAFSLWPFRVEFKIFDTESANSWTFLYLPVRSLFFCGIMSSSTSSSPSASLASSIGNSSSPASELASESASESRLPLDSLSDPRRYLQPHGRYQHRNRHDPARFASLQ